MSRTIEGIRYCNKNDVNVLRIGRTQLGHWYLEFNTPTATQGLLPLGEEQAHEWIHRIGLCEHLVQWFDPDAEPSHQCSECGE